MKSISEIWHKLFLEERPSVSLGFFRIAVALTLGTHVIPTLIPMEDNYLATAFKEKNPNFFPHPILALVEKSPDSLVWFMASLFYIFWFFFLVGWKTQVSGILTVIACYYFYALNSLHIGTLSWDILLVALFLMCMTSYPGDAFSVDALFRKSRGGPAVIWRPFFIQRLLQCQLAWTYFYTALYKITPGNWLMQNPYYYLMNQPLEGVIRDFWFRDYLTAHPDLCYGIGVGVIICEILASFFLFIPRLRIAAIIYGFIFHILLLVTMHVPTIFFFLFPPQFLLFIPPEKWLKIRQWGRPADIKS